MFDQFRTDLGLYATDGLLPDPLRGTYNGQKNAVDGAVTLAQSSAQVSIDSVTTIDGVATGRRSSHESGRSQAPFGSQFPPRVPGLPGARRSRTTFCGNLAAPMLTASLPTPLASRWSLSSSARRSRPINHTSGPAIRLPATNKYRFTRRLVRDPQGQLTTSFLSLDDKVKDNRILPQGWSSSGPNGDITKPEGTGADPNYQNGCGCSVVRYQVPLTAVPGAATVQATLYYQSIPPYYLSQRSKDASGPDTRETDQFHEPIGRQQVH